MVSIKVSDSEKFGIGNKFRTRFRSDFGYRHTLDGMSHHMDDVSDLILGEDVDGCVDELYTEVLKHMADIKFIKET